MEANGVQDDPIGLPIEGCTPGGGVIPHNVRQDALFAAERQGCARSVLECSQDWMGDQRMLFIDL